MKGNSSSILNCSSEAVHHASLILSLGVAMSIHNVYLHLQPKHHTRFSVCYLLCPTLDRLLAIRVGYGTSSEIIEPQAQRFET